MNIYWDTSALIKRYLLETASSAVVSLLAREPISATVAITRAEVAGVFSRALSKGKITQEQMKLGIRQFRQHWPAYLRIRITEPVVRDADYLAIEYSLRGYDAIHLAGALIWKDRIGEPIQLATFDDNLWRAAVGEGFEVFPDSLPSEVIKSEEQKRKH